MIVSTQGIVLHTLNYGESSAIVKVFTRLYGLRGYIVKGLMTRKNKALRSMLQPMTELDMVVYDSPKKDLNFIKEMRIKEVDTTLDAVALALRFFKAEVLYRTLAESEPQPLLYDYVSQSRSNDIDTLQVRCHEPIVFLLHTARMLGFEPQNNYTSSLSFFNLASGQYEYSADITSLPATQSVLLHHYLLSAFEGYSLPSVAPVERETLLQNLITYFQHHIATFGTIHSHEILHTILH